MTKKTTNLTQLKSFELGALIWSWHPEGSKYYQVKVIARVREHWEGKRKTWRLKVRWEEEDYEGYVWYNTHNNRLEFMATYNS